MRTCGFVDKLFATPGLLTGSPFGSEVLSGEKPSFEARSPVMWRE